MNGIDGTYASPAVRDGFLSALDRRDAVTLSRLARNLTGCANPLPSTTCTQLRIPIGSTYGFAARRVIVRGMEGALEPNAVIASVDESPSLVERLAREAFAAEAAGTPPVA
ncbi:MAG: hypothetical protein ABI585_05610 [Betaproteobacteria bacterium]